MLKIEETSLDITQDNIEKLKQLFPNVVTEGKIDFDVLRNLLGDEVDDSKEKYQFTWKGKAQSIKLAQSPSRATLRPDKSSSKNWDTTENLYIEGDNLEVLKQLQKTYYGKIKMIYIDPPYNTGKDFVYKDDFKNSLDNYKEQTNQTSKSNPETSGRFHTDWLNMMYPRLLLARNLLSDDGLIFISIGEHESDNLKKICVEIFGSENLIEYYIWESTFRPDNSSKIMRRNAEYVLCFAKNISKIDALIGEVKEKEGLPSLTKASMKSRVLTFPANTVKTYLKNGKYFAGQRDSYNLLNDVYVVDGIILNEFSLEGHVIWSQENLDKELSLGTQIIIKGDGFVPYTKKVGDSVMAPTKLIPNTLVGDVLSANSEMGKLFVDRVFSYPKPVSLIEYFIKYFDCKDFIILDFFSGSATTAHSIFKLNKKDLGSRKFILVQLPENLDENLKNVSDKEKVVLKNAIEVCDLNKSDHNICEIAKERIRRAGEYIKKEWEEEHSKDGLFASDEEFKTDIGFKVFKLDSTNINEWDSTRTLDEIELSKNLKEVFKTDRSKEDVLYEIMLKYGVFDMPVSEIDVNGKTMYRVGKRYMIVCLEDSINSEDIKAIAQLQPKTVIFNEAGFKDDNDKINAEYNLQKAGVEDVKCI